MFDEIRDIFTVDSDPLRLSELSFSGAGNILLSVEISIVRRVIMHRLVGHFNPLDLSPFHLGNQSQ